MTAAAVPAARLGILVAATALSCASAGASWRSVPARARAVSLAGSGQRGVAQHPAAFGLVRRLDAHLTDAAVAGSARAWAAAWGIAVGAGSCAGWVFGGVSLGLIAAGSAVATPLLVLRGRRGRAGDHADAALPPALEAMAAGLRAGSTLPLAVTAAAEGAGGVLGADLRLVAQEAAVVGLSSAADAWAARRPRPAVRLAAAALALSAEVGGAGARALDGVALTLRQRREAVAEVRALATQARLSAVVLGAAPVVFAGLAAAADHRTLRFLLVDSAGQICLAVGVALDAAGAAWMARTTRAGAL